MSERRRKKNVAPPPPRRGVLDRLKRLFQGPYEGPFFLGVQVVVDFAGYEDQQRRLVELFGGSRPHAEIPAPKDAFIRRAVALLLELEPAWSYCFWDYVDDEAERAVAEHRAWTLDINAGMALDEAEKGMEPEDDDPASSRHKYVAVSLVFLMNQPYPYAEITDEDRWFKRATLRLLVEKLVSIDVREVVADGAYILPGTVEEWFTEDDLLDSTWSYLRELFD